MAVDSASAAEDAEKLKRNEGDRRHGGIGGDVSNLSEEVVTQAQPIILSLSHSSSVAM